LRKRRGFEVQHALRDINFEVKKGEFFGIVGRNGSGKSTLLKIMADIYQPTKGTVTSDGRIVSFIELGVGFNAELTGRENVYLNGAMFGFSEKEVDAMYDDIVRFAELEKFMDQKLKNYSSGMQVRLAFSMATRAHADILLVDEVLAVGDAAFQRKCYNYFKSLKRDKKTVVFVSHDMDAVREYCDRAILIDDSRLQREGKPEIISQAYLRLFNEYATGDTADLSGDDKRWGNRAVVIDSVDYELTAKKLSLTYHVTAKQDTSEIIYGFRLRADDGSELLGTNSTILRQAPLSLTKGQQAEISWELPNVLSNGKYFIDPSLILKDGATVLDWWNEAKTFQVEKTKSTTYPVTPDITVKVKGPAT
jgi:ABC-2 type transport system ATP-binding protein